MKKVMVRAWEIAKEAVKKFGGKVKEFFSQALKMAWAEIKGGVKVVGTEKQVVWANEIKKEMISECSKVISHDFAGVLEVMNKMNVTVDEVLVKATGTPMEKMVLDAKKWIERKAKIEACEDAVWFINNKDNLSWI